MLGYEHNLCQTLSVTQELLPRKFASGGLYYRELFEEWNKRDDICYVRYNQSPLFIKRVIRVFFGHDSGLTKSTAKREIINVLCYADDNSSGTLYPEQLDSIAKNMMTNFCKERNKSLNDLLDISGIMIVSNRVPKPLCVINTYLHAQPNHKNHRLVCFTSQFKGNLFNVDSTLLTN